MRRGASHGRVSYDDPCVTAAVSSPPVSPSVPALALPSALLRRHLEEPKLRARIAAMVRRRVPAGDADDVVQSVLEGALAAERPPVDERELGPWLWGIARNKVADFHRRARRDVPSDEERGALDGRAEARVLLAAVVADAAAMSRGEETLEWIMREHAGDELAQIADESRLAAPVVRQRVSRLRRALRSRWLGTAGALALVLATGAGLARLVAAAAAPETIVADPTGSSTEAALASVGGEWRVEAGRAKGARVRIAGARVTVELAGVQEERAIVVEEATGASLTARVVGGGEARRVTVRLEEGALIVSDAAGTVRLVRP